jgi:hypothetical protein
MDKSQQAKILTTIRISNLDPIPKLSYHIIMVLGENSEVEVTWIKKVEAESTAHDTSIDCILVQGWLLE